ncbi:MAG: hypothetical protein M3Y27_16875, partial [Acidobacteriota bacterium]|nr:hypothetical protein [Acidobacteriota bacterium]
VRSTYERRNPRSQPGQRPLRRVHALIEHSPCGVVVNAVAAMAIGSSLYAIRYAYVRYRTTPAPAAVTTA